MVAKKKILIIEDNPTNLILFQDVLHSYGYEVMSATTATQAFDLLETFTPDLLLMDIHLPDMDGISAIKAIRSTPRYASIVILGLSAFAMEHDIAKAMEAGCNGYITKPISIRSFIEEIQKYI